MLNKISSWVNIHTFCKKYHPQNCNIVIFDAIKKLNFTNVQLSVKVHLHVWWEQTDSDSCEMLL